MPRLLLALLLLAAALLQAGLLPRLTLLQVRPNLVLVIILLWTLARGLREGALWAAGCGLVLDLLTVAPLGTHGLGLLGVAGVGAVGRTPRFRLGWLPPLLAVLAATLVHDALILLGQREWTLLPSHLLRLSLLSGMLNVIVTPPFLLAISRLAGWLARIEELAGRPTATPAASRLPRR